MTGEKKLDTDRELSLYIARRNVLKAKYNSRISFMDRKINKYLLKKNEEEATKILNDLINDPKKSLFEYGVGGYIEEEQRKERIYQEIKAIDKKTKELLKG
jgi:hypothetical protein